MKVILIEDELPAIEKLTHFLKKYDSDSDILGVASSIARLFLF